MALSVTGLLSGLAVQGDPGVDRFQRLPKGWVVTKSVPMATRSFGGQTVEIANHVFSVDGRPLQINTVVCKTEKDAAAAQELLLRVHQGMQEFCPREGRTVFEFVGKDMRLVERAYLELEFKPPKVIYDVSFQAAPIEKCDPMIWNKLFNAFLVAEPDKVQIGKLSESFVFGEQIRIRNHGLGSEASSFSFSPKPVKSRADANGELTVISFAELPKQHGVPQVAVEAVVTSEAFALTPTRRRAGKELLEATEFWPSADGELIALAKRITGAKTEPADKVAALLDWFVESKPIKYAGEVGSRYGVKAVLKQGFGRCWDSSDCFVTLCRAASVPSRQVVGWLHGQGGHIWAEVLLEGKGWRQVDPTTGMGCDSRYVPFIATENGAIPMVYTSAVRTRPRSPGAAAR